MINNVKVLSIRDHRNDESRLKQYIHRHLKDNKYPAESLDVQVRNGHVILSGFVNKHVSLDDIKPLVESVPGAATVDNHLLYKQA